MRRDKTNLTKYSSKGKALISHYKSSEVTAGIDIYCAFLINFDYEF